MKAGKLATGAAPWTNQACPSGQVMSGFNSAGKVVCVTPKDANTTYSAGTGLLLSKGAFSVNLGYLDGKYVNEGQANSVTSAMVVDGSLSGADIKNGSITASDLAASSVTGTQVANSSLTGADLKDGSVGAKDLAANSVTGATVLDSSLTGADIKNASIGNVDLANNAVTGAKVADGTLTGADIANGSIANGDLGTNAVTGSKVADGSLTGADIGRAHTATRSTPTHQRRVTGTCEPTQRSSSRTGAVTCDSFKSISGNFVSGYVGIGDFARYPLDVYKYESSKFLAYFHNTYSNDTIVALGGYSAGLYVKTARTDTTTGYIAEFRNHTATAMTIDSNRRVGINTNAPGYNLEVNGTLQADSIRVGSSTLASYIDGRIRTYVRSKCYVYFGWRDSCDGCTSSPSKWGYMRGDGTCFKTGTNSTCAGSWLGINTDGDVNGDDKFYIRLRCD